MRQWQDPKHRTECKWHCFRLLVPFDAYELDRAACQAKKASFVGSSLPALLLWKLPNTVLRVSPVVMQSLSYIQAGVSLFGSVPETGCSARTQVQTEYKRKPFMPSSCHHVFTVCAICSLQFAEWFSKVLLKSWDTSATASSLLAQTKKKLPWPASAEVFWAYLLWSSLNAALWVFQPQRATMPLKILVAKYRMGVAQESDGGMQAKGWIWQHLLAWSAISAKSIHHCLIGRTHGHESYCSFLSINAFKV